MKTCVYATFLSLLAIASIHAATMAQWDFNSLPPDSSVITGTSAPSFGDGVASLIGGVSASFATGSTNDPAASADDSGWNISDYPAQNADNKTAGVQFNVSTLSFSNIVVRWDQRASGSASKYCRLQYSTDGVNFIDYPTPVSAQVVSSTQSYFEAQTNSLAAFPGVDNNPNFAFRIVTEFESTAVGGTAGYVTTAGNNYSTAGTIRFDLVTVLGTPIPGANTPPGISTISNQTVRINQSTAALPFTVNDAQDAASSLNVTGYSSDAGILPNANIHLGGTGAQRTVLISATSQTGTAIVTLWAVDTGGRSNKTSFAVTVLPLNTAPVISEINSTNTLANQTTAEIPFTIYDLESPAENLSVTGVSANPSLVPNGNIVFGGSGSNRSLTVTPAYGQSGVALVTVIASDGTNNSSSVFALMVLPSPDVLFYDPFSYADGSLITSSAFLWSTRSGEAGACQVVNGRVQISSDETEDVSATLAGAPFVRSNGTVLYASFELKTLELPRNIPSYFASFSSGSANRGRVYIGTTNATPGMFRLFTASGSDETTVLPMDLQTNASYRIVTRYEVDTAMTTLWLDPVAESDFHVTATDAPTTATISHYTLRQDSTLSSTLLVDNLRVGLSFAAVLPGAASPIPLNFQRQSGKVILSWSDSGFALQSAPTASGVYTNVPGAVSPFTNTITSGAKFFRLKK